MRLVAKHDAFFTGGHLYHEEIFELARLANKEGAKMLIDHAFCNPLALPMTISVNSRS
jgi:alanine-alpha-ketoisovalerate/valine-pyruvate aminotransferase